MQPKTTTVEIDDKAIQDLLVRQFKALKKAFDTEETSGIIRAYDLVEMLTQTAENDPEIFRTILTEENIIAFTKLKRKGEAKGGNIGISDLIQAFPAIGGALKGGMLKGFLK